MTPKRTADGRELEPVSRTALWTAASRARESGRTDRLFHDPFAATLAGPMGLAMLEKGETPPDGQNYLPVRTRWYDDTLAALAAGGTRQLVLLAAGMDTRAYRRAWPAGTTVFELDRPELHAHKQAVLDQLHAVPGCARRPVEADLTADWVSPLHAAGYRPDEPAVWVAEGLLFYLTEHQARELLTTAARCCASGSLLVADFVNTNLLSAASLRPLTETFAELGAPWQFGTDEPTTLLSDCGWMRTDLVVTGEEPANFSRLPTPTANEDDPRGYLVTATRRGLRMSSTHDTNESTVDASSPRAGTDPAAVERLLSLYFGHVASRALHTAVTLGVADALGDGEADATELAAATGTHTPTLTRLLRALEHLGVLTETRPDHYGLTPMGTHLRSDVPHSLRATVDLFCRTPLWRAWEALPTSMRTGKPAFECFSGTMFYDHCGRDPELSALMRAELGEESRAVMRELATGYDFSDVGTVVDVGGGTGTALSAVLHEHPHLRGVLVDTEAGSDPTAAVLHEAGVHQQCRCVVGDFFDEVPTGGDRYLLKSVLVDWDDDRAAIVLGNCRNAMPDDARLLLVDQVHDAHASTARMTAMCDLVALATSGGRVRSEAEFADLLGRTGFTLATSIPLSGGYRILEAVPEAA